MPKKLIFFLFFLSPFLSYSMKRSGSNLAAPAKRARVSTEICELLATPQDDIVEKIVQDIDSVGASGYVGIETPSLSNTEITSSILEAAQKGTQVYLFVDEPKNQNNPQELIKRYNHLKKNNIKVIEIPDLHAKRVLVAQEKPFKENKTIVYLGSLNMNDFSDQNYEIMMRCADHSLFIENYQDQQRITNKEVYKKYAQQAKPVQFNSRRIISSFAPQAVQARKKNIEDFANCQHPHDKLYVSSFILDDPTIIDALINTQKKTNKPIEVIVDGSIFYNQDETKKQTLKKLVDNGITVFAYNKDGSKKRGAYPKLFHIKSMLRSCNQQCFSLLSTANFTLESNSQINHDLWEPCTAFSRKLKKLFDQVIRESTKLTSNDFLIVWQENKDENGKKIIKLMKYSSETKKNESAILRLIPHANLEFTNEYGNTPLITAIHHNNLPITRALIEAGANVNVITTDPQNRTFHTTPLLAAATSGNEEIVQLLIEKGIDPTLNYADEYGNTPLFRAIQGKHLNVVKALLQAGADPDIGGDYREATRSFPAGTTPPLIQAVRSGNLEIVNELLNHDADINAKDREGKTAFDRAVSKPKILELLEVYKMRKEGKFDF